MLNVVTGGEPREQRALRRHRAQGGAVRPHRRVPRGGARRLGPGAVRLRRRALPGRGRDGERRRSTRCRTSTSAAPPGPAGPVAARHADVYLTWGEPPELVAREDRLDARARRRAGSHAALRAADAHALPRHPEEAWAHAQWLLDGLDPATRRRGPRPRCGASESTGQQRMLALRGGRTSYADAHELEVSPNLWSGVGLVRGGAGTALVGSHEEVADRLAEYARARASTSSSSPATRTSRRRTGSARA